jgi:hypothetical protein
MKKGPRRPSPLGRGVETNDDEEESSTTNKTEGTD